MLAFELVFRAQLVDTYTPELRAFNSEEVLREVPEDTGRETILALGDSFTAGYYSYPVQLRKSLPQYRVVNAGISGTGAVQAAMVAPARFSRFKPSVFIYQIFVGNDLINIRYDVNWRELPFTYNVYWSLSNRLRSVQFLNYRLAQMLAMRRAATANPPQVKVKKPPAPVVVSPEVAPAGSKTPRAKASPPRGNTFSIERYHRLERLYFKAEPHVLEDQVMLSGKRNGDFSRLLENLDKVLAHCRAPECAPYVIVIPHASQVSPLYLERARLLGADFTRPGEMLQDEYPFIRELRRHLSKDPRVEVLNPIAMLRQGEEQGTTLYNANDQHLNKAGQRLITGLLVDAITGKK